MYCTCRQICIITVYNFKRRDGIPEISPQISSQYSSYVIQISECGVRTGRHGAGALRPQLPHHSGQRHGHPRHQNREETSDCK
jgi:hypothetical protein